MKTSKNNSQLPTMKRIVNSRPFLELIDEGLLEQYLRPTPKLKEQLKNKKEEFEA